jgi:pantetheine-phosphate adenylyltransferase
MKTCVFPGTFNPFTNGHLDIVKRAASVFGDVIVAVAENSGKTGVLDTKDRITLVEKCIGSVKGARVTAFSGLLVNFCKEEGARVIVRGIRDVNDFEFENTLSFVNKKLSPGIETVYMVTSHEYSHVSGSIVRELISLNADITAFVPAEIKSDLIKLYGADNKPFLRPV